jgi:hypothetical protein
MGLKCLLSLVFQPSRRILSELLLVLCSFALNVYVGLLLLLMSRGFFNGPVCLVASRFGCLGGLFRSLSFALRGGDLREDLPCVILRRVI